MCDTLACVALGILPLMLCLGLGSSQLGLYVRVCWEQQELPRRYFRWHPRVILRMSANWDDPFLLHHSSNSCFFPFLCSKILPCSAQSQANYTSMGKHLCIQQLQCANFSLMQFKVLENFTVLEKIESWRSCKQATNKRIRKSY